MPIIAGRTEFDPDDRDEAAAVMRDPLTRACDAPGCVDVAITVDSVDPTGAVPTSRMESGVVRVIDTPEASHIRYRIRRRTDERTI